MNSEVQGHDGTSAQKPSQQASGWGADAAQEQRPGVPMERKPTPVSGTHWTEPERQGENPRLTRRAQLSRLTPVYGSAQPPKGVAGQLRRLGYSIPENKIGHWMVLLLADRVEVLGHRFGKLLKVALPLGAAFFALRLARR